MKYTKEVKSRGQTIKRYNKKQKLNMLKQKKKNPRSFVFVVVVMVKSKKTKKNGSENYWKLFYFPLFQWHNQEKILYFLLFFFFQPSFVLKTSRFLTCNSWQFHFSYERRKNDSISFHRLCFFFLPIYVPCTHLVFVETSILDYVPQKWKNLTWNIRSVNEHQMAKTRIFFVRENSYLTISFFFFFSTLLLF